MNSANDPEVVRLLAGHSPLLISISPWAIRQSRGKSLSAIGEHLQYVIVLLLRVIHINSNGGTQLAYLALRLCLHREAQF